MQTIPTFLILSNGSSCQNQQQISGAKYDTEVKNSKNYSHKIL